MMQTGRFRKDTRTAIRYGLGVLCFVLVLSGCAYKFRKDYFRVEVQEPVPQKALTYAIKQLGKPYNRGGQGPDSFDCSGIIIRTYNEAMRTPVLLMNKRYEICDDVTIDELYNYNVRPLRKDELLPGDIVFITNEKDRVTHGGLFVEWKDDKTIEFLNASSYYGKVLIDDWPVEGTKRGQWLVGFGRLMVRWKE